MREAKRRRVRHESEPSFIAETYSIGDTVGIKPGIHDARNFDEYTVLAGDTTNKMAFLGGEEGATLCIALLCTIVLRRRLSSKKRSTWARKWFRRQRWDVFL
jgi:hypothetical protein